LLSVYRGFTKKDDRIRIKLQMQEERETHYGETTIEGGGRLRNTAHILSSTIDGENLRNNQQSQKTQHARGTKEGSKQFPKRYKKISHITALRGGKARRIKADRKKIGRVGKKQKTHWRGIQK